MDIPVAVAEIVDGSVVAADSSQRVLDERISQLRKEIEEKEVDLDTTRAEIEALKESILPFFGESFFKRFIIFLCSKLNLL